MTEPHGPREPGARGGVPRCFDRNARLFGEAGMRALADAHVVVFGLGGVGSYAAEGLARSGVGRLTLVDFDEVCITNVNRQLHAFPATVGRAKCDLLAERMRAINPRGRFDPVRKFYDRECAEEFFALRPDFMIDAIDNITAKLHLLFTCIDRALPIVTCLGASAKVDPTRVRVTSLDRTHTDPLARVIRDNLRHKYGVTTERMARIPAVYSAEPVIFPTADYTASLCGVECVCPNRGNDRHTCAKRSVIHGSSVLVTSAFGMAAAGAVVRTLADRHPLDLESDGLDDAAAGRRPGGGSRGVPGKSDPERIG